MNFKSIMEKLKNADSFPGYPNYIRHKNGNTQDNNASNLEIVNIKKAFTNISTWKVDWILELTEEEVSFMKGFLKDKGDQAVSEDDAEAVQRQYIDTLLSQGQDNLNICPNCFQEGKRNPNCTNPVLATIKGEKKLVCCALGELNREEPTLEEATAIVLAEQEAYIAGTMSIERQLEIHSEFPNALADWDRMKQARNSRSKGAYPPWK